MTILIFDSQYGFDAEISKVLGSRNVGLCDHCLVSLVLIPLTLRVLPMAD